MNENRNLKNIISIHSDVLKNKTNLENESVDYVALFNILHNEHPKKLISESQRILKRGGELGIIHWRKDIAAPRGPELNIRPTVQNILDRVENNKFSLLNTPVLIKPFHFGRVLTNN